MEQTLTEKLQRIKELNDQVRLDSIEYNEKLVELGLDQLQESVKHLTIGCLRHDLNLAYDLVDKCFSNADNDAAIQILDIDIDGSCSLHRGGYNAEDHGVYVKAMIVDSKSITIVDKPINVIVATLTGSGYSPCTIDVVKQLMNDILRQTTPTSSDSITKNLTDCTKLLRLYDDYNKSFDAMMTAIREL